MTWHITDSGLRRLFGKIKAQRDEWATSSNQDTAHVDEPPNSKTVPPEVVHVPSKHHFDTGNCKILLCSCYQDVYLIVYPCSIHESMFILIL